MIMGFAVLLEKAKEKLADAKATETLRCIRGQQGMNSISCRERIWKRHRTKKDLQQPEHMEYSPPRFFKIFM